MAGPGQKAPARDMNRSFQTLSCGRPLYNTLALHSQFRVFSL